MLMSERMSRESGAMDWHVVTVMFSDIVGFTALSERTSPDTLVATLNECFSLFDTACLEHGVEKIKTIGDAYASLFDVC